MLPEINFSQFISVERHVFAMDAFNFEAVKRNAMLDEQGFHKAIRFLEQLFVAIDKNRCFLSFSADQLDLGDQKIWGRLR